MNTHLDGTRNSVFIASLRLRGSRSAQLMQLDEQLSRLHAIRRTLATDDVSPIDVDDSFEETSAKRWFVAGVGMVLVLALVTLTGWVTRPDVTAPPAAVSAVVGARR